MVFWFGLITGIAFDMPVWWWVLGFVFIIIDMNIRTSLYDKRRKLKVIL